jgi:hypothetical protein
MTLEIPNDFFEPPSVRDETWPDYPDLRRGVEWFKGFMTEAEWKSRRLAAAKRLYDAALGRLDAGDKGRFFAEGDTLGWYLFLAEAFLDHVWNYEPTYGSRVVPVFAAIGRDLELLRQIDGLNDRVRRLVGPERRQPNGGLFELLVAAAYRRAGGAVAFLPERPGRAKTHDMDVSLHGRTWAVECKRMETGNYGEQERARVRELWGPSAAGLSKEERSTFCNTSFKVTTNVVPNDYLTRKTHQWLASGLPSLLWDDEVSRGVIGDLDLDRLREVLIDNNVLVASSRIHELLTGRYVRHANYVQALRIKPAHNPRYVDDCDLAVLLRWESLAPEAVDNKARDILRKLAEANSQLPNDRPGIVHVGFEAVEGDAVERARYQKILASTARFDPGAKHLEYVYCHYFVPESPPDQAWAFDETTQWCPIRPTGPLPLRGAFLILPEAARGRSGPHWQV